MLTALKVLVSPAPSYLPLMESPFQRPPSSSAPCPVTLSQKDMELTWHSPFFKSYIVVMDHLRIYLVTCIVPSHSVAFGIHSNPGGVHESVGSQTSSQL